MAYARPTLTQLRDDALQDIEAAQVISTSGTILAGLLQKAILRVLAYVEAGMAYEHYGFIDYVSKQAVPWTATDEFLEAWAALKGVTRKPASQATGTATFSGSPDGTPIPNGTAVSRVGDGVAYVTTTTESVSGSAVTVPIQAVIAGSAGDFATNTAFRLANPIAGILSQSTASAQSSAGADAELDGSLRTRMLQVYAAPPQGGDKSDYVEWTLAVAGVTRAWVAPNAMGAGTISVFFMMDEAESAFDGFPQGSNGVATNEPRDTAATGDQLVVANAIFPQQPVTALLYSVAPIASPVNFTVSDLGPNNTTPMQNAITAALTDMFVRLANVGGTVDPKTGAAWPALEPSDWYAALEAIPGLNEFKVTVPSGSIAPSTGQLFTLGTISFNT